MNHYAEAARTVTEARIDVGYTSYTDTEIKVSVKFCPDTNDYHIRLPYDSIGLRADTWEEAVHMVKNCLEGEEHDPPDSVLGAAWRTDQWLQEDKDINNYVIRDMKTMIQYIEKKAGTRTNE